MGTVNSWCATSRTGRPEGWFLKFRSTFSCRMAGKDPNIPPSPRHSQNWSYLAISYDSASDAKITEKLDRALGCCTVLSKLAPEIQQTLFEAAVQAEGERMRQALAMHLYDTTNAPYNQSKPRQCRSRTASAAETVASRMGRG
jgi:hypothetical protein